VWPDPTGSLDNAGARVVMRLTPTGVEGTTYECRTGPAASFTATTPPWAACDGGSGMNPTHTPQLPGGLDEGGSFRTEFRFTAPPNPVSAPVGYDYYVHNSLNGIPTCTRPFTDQEYFDFARASGSFPTTTTFPDDDRVQLRNPHIRILFVGASASDAARSGGSLINGMAMPFSLSGMMVFDFPFGVDSLRHKYVISSDRTMILMRRFYRGFDNTCRDEQWIGSKMGAMPPHRLDCDAWVVNSKGQGICLAGTSAIAVQPLDLFIAPGAGTNFPGTVTAPVGGSTVTGTGTNFSASWVGCYLHAGYRWHRITAVASATSLTLADPLPFGISGAPRRHCSPVTETLVSPTGYIKLRNNDDPRAGSSVSRNKCTAAATCNDTDETRIMFLPP
jgi:hypothetical protein